MSSSPNATVLPHPQLPVADFEEDSGLVLSPMATAELSAWFEGLDEIDRTLASIRQDASTSPSYDPLSQSIHPPHTFQSMAYESSASPSRTAYDSASPCSDATLLASPIVSSSPVAKTPEGEPLDFDLSAVLEEMSDSLLGYGSYWYGSQFSVDHDHEAAPAFPTNESTMLPLAASGAQDVWNGEQQCRGLAAAPSTSTHSHRQDVGGSADPSAVASTSTAVPGPDAPVAPEAPTSRKRKAKKTSNAQTEDGKSKKPKSTSYECPYEGCSYGERTAARRHELSSCVSRRSE